MKNLFITMAAFTLIAMPLTAKAGEEQPKAAATAATTAETAAAQQQPHAFFVNLKDGDTVTNPVHIVFGLDGMDVAPAGTDKPNTGHFHLLIDTQLTDEEKNFAIPNDDQHMHFGKGQTETDVTLSPGEHTLRIVMGDAEHMLHNPPVMSDTIHITVAE